MTEKNRRVAFLLAMTVFFAMLFSACFVIAEAEHDCIGDDCPVCCQLLICEDTLKAVGQAVIALLLAACIRSIAIILPVIARKPAYQTSLITLKVKLSD